MRRDFVSRSKTPSSLVILISLAAPSLSGCDLAPEATRLFNDSIGRLIGFKLPSERPGQTKDAGSAPATEPDSPDNRQMNAEFIREMFRVTLLRDVRSREEFDKYMNVMDQGGHYESIYNGVVYAAEFREKEKGVTPIPSLKAYSEVMAELKLNQKYNSINQAASGASANPEPQPTSASGASGPSDAERIAVTAQIERDAITKSTFALKRELGEEALKTIDLKREYRDKLATWYGKFTVFLNKRGVDFGIPLRNKSDELFHYKWALDADEDRIKWETLNRIQRLLNNAAGLREPAVAPAVPTPSNLPIPAPATPAQAAPPTPTAAATPVAQPHQAK